MNEAIEKLKNIGLVRISQETHISAVKLENILEKRFSVLDSTTAHGFIQILEREYNVDLSEWMQEFDAYLAEASEAVPEDKLFVTPQSKRQNLRWVLYVVLLAALGIGGYAGYQMFKQDISELISDFQESETSEPGEPIDPPEIPETPVISEEPSEPDESGTEMEMETSEETGMLENNLSEVPIAEEAVLPDGEAETESFETEASETLEAVETPILTEAAKILGIEPNVRLWVGIINLETFRKRDFITTEGFELNTSFPQLLVLGHGDVRLKIDDNVTNLQERNPVRLHYDGEMLNIISIQEFRNLNRGEIW